jgi:DNA-binding CsgD family transcriptional regulator
MARRGRPRHPDVLTPRQREVLGLVREGLTNPQIASRLGISPDGAKWHVKEIIERLGVTTRREAARWEEQRGPAGAGASPRAHLVTGGAPARRGPARHRHLDGARPHHLDRARGGAHRTRVHERTRARAWRRGRILAA